MQVSRKAREAMTWGIDTSRVALQKNRIGVPAMLPRVEGK